MGAKGMLIDTSKCQACKACQIACQQWHSLEAEDTTFTGSYQNPPDMSGANLTIVKFIEFGNNGTLRWLFFKDQCRHCENPTCRTACPLVPKAIKRQKNGIVRIDPDLCHPELCSTEDVKPCQKACPFKTETDENGNPLSQVGIPKRNYTKFKDGPVVTIMRKCDFCYNRLADPKLRGDYDPIPPHNVHYKAPYPLIPSVDVKYKGSNIPACALTCPPGAIKIYSADTSAKVITKIRNKANARVAELISNGYPNAQVYPAGLQTHVIWILLEHPSVYGIVPA